MNLPFPRSPLCQLLLAALLLTTAVPVHAQELGPVQRLEGLVQPNRQAVLAAPVAARLREVPAQEGDVVEAQHLLAQMDDALQQVAVEAARLRAQSDTAVERAQAAQEEAKVTAQAVQRSFDARAASEWELRQAQLQHEQARLDTELAKQQRELAQTEFEMEEQRLRQFRIEAPFEGQVVEVLAESGSYLEAGDEVLVVADLDPLEAQLYLPVELMGQLQVGKVYQLEAGQPVNRMLEGKLTYIDPRIDQASGTFRALLQIANPEQTMPAGFVVQLVTPNATPATQ